MSPRTNCFFLVLFFLISFGTLCMSQCYDRNEVPHYLCWVACFASFAMFGRHCFIAAKDDA